MKRANIVGLIGLVLFFAAANVAMACSCDLPTLGTPLKQQVKNARKNSDVIFVGRIVEVRFSNDEIGGWPATRYAKFQMARSWRGPLTEYVEIATPNICCICGITFEAGATYIVYADSNDRGIFWTNSCSRTSPIGIKSDDEKYLGKKRLMKKAPKI